MSVLRRKGILQRGERGYRIADEAPPPHETPDEAVPIAAEALDTTDETKQDR